MSWIVGIDPGLSGAIAWHEDGAIMAKDMPIFEIVKNRKKRRYVNADVLTDYLCGEKISHVYIEAVAAMPGQGVSSMFRFGEAFGIVQGVVAALGLPRTMVAPRTWKKAMGLSSDKELSRRRATELFPDYSELFRLRRHADRAEATLLALYGSQL